MVVLRHRNLVGPLPVRTASRSEVRAASKKGELFAVPLEQPLDLAHASKPAHHYSPSCLLILVRNRIPGGQLHLDPKASRLKRNSADLQVPGRTIAEPEMETDIDEAEGDEHAEEVHSRRAVLLFDTDLYVDQELANLQQGLKVPIFSQSIS